MSIPILSRFQLILHQPLLDLYKKMYSETYFSIYILIWTTGRNKITSWGKNTTVSRTGKHLVERFHSRTQEWVWQILSQKQENAAMTQTEQRKQASFLEQILKSNACHIHYAGKGQTRTGKVQPFPRNRSKCNYNTEKEENKHLSLNRSLSLMHITSKRNTQLTSTKYQKGEKQSDS